MLQMRSIVANRKFCSVLKTDTTTFMNKRKNK